MYVTLVIVLAAILGSTWRKPRFPAKTCSHKCDIIIYEIDAENVVDC